MAKSTTKIGSERSKKRPERGLGTRHRRSANAAPEAVAAFERAADAAAVGADTHTIDRSDRIAAGRAMRKAVPRNSHGDWTAAADRPDPVAVSWIRARPG